MKKLIAALAVLTALLCACGLAFADEITLGSTGLTLTLPSGWQQDSLDATDISDGALCYWYNDDMDLVAYLNSTDETLAELVADDQADSEIIEAGYVSGQPGGLSFGYSLYRDTDSEGTYYGMDYFTVSGGQVLEIIFFMDDTSYVSQAESILRTLKGTGTASSSQAGGSSAAASQSAAGSVTVGSSGLSIVLSSGFAQESLTQDDISDGIVAYWYSDLLDLVVYEEDSQGILMSELLAELQQDSEYSQSGTTTMPSGIEFVYGVASYTQDGESLVAIEYYTVTGNELVTFQFIMLEADKSVASSQAAAIIETVTK